MTTQQVVIIERAEGCDCSEVYLPALLVGSNAEAGDWIDCPHGSKLTVLDARVVECLPCRATGRRMRSDIVRSYGEMWMRGSMDKEEDCPDCLGFGQRLATLDPPNGSAG